MNINALVAAISFLIFGLGIFLGAGVRPVLQKGWDKNPAFVGSALTSIFGRYNIVCLILATLCLASILLSSARIALVDTVCGLVALLALKLPIDSVIRARERDGQVRGIGKEGRGLDLLHKFVECLTIGVLVLALTAFVLSVIKI